MNGISMPCIGGLADGQWVFVGDGRQWQGRVIEVSLPEEQNTAEAIPLGLEPIGIQPKFYKVRKQVYRVEVLRGGDRQRYVLLAKELSVASLIDKLVDDYRKPI